jgi:hypothetical protein
MKAESTQVLETLAEWQMWPQTYVREAMGVNAENGFAVDPLQADLFRVVGEMAQAKLKYKDVCDGRAPKSSLSERDWFYVKKQGISVMSGKGSGKGFSLVMLICWFLQMFDRCKSPITGPSFDQINKGLLAECHKWVNMKSPKTGEPIAVVGSEFEILNDKIYLKSEGPKSRFFAVRTAPPDANESQQKGVLDGWHEDAMMVVVDEAASIQDGVFTSFNTTLTRPFNFAVLMFNPTRNSGFAYDTHYGPRADAWVQLHWDARKSTLVTRAQLDAMERDYGKDGPEYRINVLGLPPVDDPSSLISQTWIQNAVDRWESDDDETWKDYPTIAGFDPAREGKDESAYVVRKGMRVIRTDGVRLTKSDELGDWALQQMAADEVDVMFIDSVGIGGPMMDYMKKTMRNPFALRAADVTKAAINERYYRTRDEKWWEVRRCFEKDLIQIPPDRILKNELGSIKQSGQTDKGKTRVETKKEMKARGMPSPNRGDALMMTLFANDDAVMAAKRGDDDGYDANDEPGNSGLSWMGR